MKLIAQGVRGFCERVAVVLSILLLGVSPAGAALFEVAAGDVAGLVAALESANDEVAFPDEDTIVLASGAVYELSSAYDTNQNGLPSISSLVNIIGDNTVISKGVSAENFRFFTVESGSALTLSHLQLTGGRADNGGAVVNHGYLEIIGGGLSGNQALYGGGAIYSTNNAWTILHGVEMRDNTSEMSSGGAIYQKSGYVEIVDSMLIGNRAPGASGGALFARMNATTFIDGSTLANNQAVNGGAVQNYFGSSMFIRNTTMTGNVASNKGGALANNILGGVELVAATLVDNRAGGLGETIYVADYDAWVSIVQSLIANSSEIVAHCYGDIVVADADSLATDNSCDDASFTTYADLMLGPLAFNGGTTMTHALNSGSVAIDRIESFEMGNTDQRGVLRPQDGDGDTFATADAGAFEHETRLYIDISPKDEMNTVKLNSSQVDVLVLSGYGGLDLTSLTAEDMVGVEIVFGEDRATMTKDLTHDKHFAHHLSTEGLMLHFSVEETGLDPSDQFACLAMTFADGQSYRGCDMVNVVP